MKPYLDILKLVWPLALGMINNALMQFVDRAYLAHESMQSLEAVLPASMLSWIFVGFFQSVVAYAGVFVAQYHGAADEERCVRSYHAGMWMAVISGLATLGCVPIGDWVLSLVTASPELIARQRSYYDIVTMGGIFVYGQMAAASYFTGRGLTRTVFWVNLLGNVLNVALDPIMIFGWFGVPRLGIAGAAYATVAAMALQWLVLIFMAHRATRRHGYPWTPDRDLLWRIFRYGVPAGGYTVLNLLSFTIFIFVTGRVGEVEFAVSNACFTVNYLLFAPMEGFALGAQTLVGQHIGAGNHREAEKAALRTLVLGVSFVALMSVVTIGCYRPILAIFAPSDMEVGKDFIDLGFKLFMLMGAWLLFDAADVIVSGALKGAGDTRFVFVWILICGFALWLPMMWAVSVFHNTMPALWSTLIVYVLLICGGTAARWWSGRWKRIRMT